MKNIYPKVFLTTLLLLLCTALSAHNFEVGGIFYNILSEEDRTVEVTYKGDSYNNYSNRYSGEVTIPANVTYNGTTYSVTTIGNHAFNGCSNLTSIEIPNSVTTIRERAFGHCSGLTSIEIPNSVTTIENGAFASCSSLTSIEIPNSVTSIGMEAFSSCRSLISIEIPNSVTTIGELAFCDCVGLTSIEIPNSVTTIGEAAFINCYGLTSVTIGNSVTTIGVCAFYGCEGLTSVTIGNSVTTIGEYAFCDCEGLTSVTSLIPADKLFIPGADAFYNVPTSCTLYVPAGAKERYAATEGWCEFTNIVEMEPEHDGTCGENAYWTLQGGVLTISGRGEMYNYSYANTASWYEYKDVINNIIINDGITTIGDYAFYNCRYLTSIEIPNSVTTIGSYAFCCCTGLTSIEIPNSVTTIGDEAFISCSNLTSIEIPNSVTTIEEDAFCGCEGLTSIVVAEDNTIYDSREDCNAIIETATNTLITGCKNTVIPNSVTTIGNSAFESCTSLTSIEIPNSVTTIEEAAFYNCRYLTSITIPNSVTTIGERAFERCRKLTSVTSLIPADKLFIPGARAFRNVPTSCTLYVPAGAKETYAATEGWNEFTNIVELPAESFDLTVSAAKYATLYLGYNATIPVGVEVYTASTVDGNRLMMEQVTDILPANTAAIVRAEQGTYKFTKSDEEVAAIENNLLQGSVEEEYITPEEHTRYYVLAMKDGVVGMYEDALSGGTFKNNAKKAYLALKGKGLGIYDEEVDTENTGAQLSNSYYFDFSGTTAIEPFVTEVEDAVYYDLSGRRVENPTRGIYILNGKKILVK
ncbi:MAG: leucine-rich repeat domain-containing protein [Bacteroidaceae bacterium]|nr:leucine-rich repeat domain-containing protein [Bacteroidaceae bacterium]